MPVLFDSSKNNQPIVSDPQNSEIVTSLNNKEVSKTMNSFLEYPHGIYFATQGKNERIALFLRQHPITQVPWILSSFILIIVPISIMPLFLTIFPFVIPDNYLVIFTLFWYLVTFVYIFINFILWYYNVNIITNHRIIDIDFLYLLVQEVNATRITQVEDVSLRQIGAIASLFNYGDVFVQTAGAEANIEFLRIPNPKFVTHIIIKLMKQTT